jgi:hypothetical protein
MPEYRKMSELKRIQPFPYCVCGFCKEIYYNDTNDDRIYCPTHKVLLESYAHEENAIARLNKVKSYPVQVDYIHSNGEPISVGDLELNLLRSPMK